MKRIFMLFSVFVAVVVMFAGVFIDSKQFNAQTVASRTTNYIGPVESGVIISESRPAGTYRVRFGYYVDAYRGEHSVDNVVQTYFLYGKEALAAGKNHKAYNDPLHPIDETALRYTYLQGQPKQWPVDDNQLYPNNMGLASVVEYFDVPLGQPFNWRDWVDIDTLDTLQAKASYLYIGANEFYEGDAKINNYNGSWLIGGIEYRQNSTINATFDFYNLNYLSGRTTKNNNTVDADLYVEVCYNLSTVRLSSNNLASIRNLEPQTVLNGNDYTDLPMSLVLSTNYVESKGVYFYSYIFEVPAGWWQVIYNVWYTQGLALKRDDIKGFYVDPLELAHCVYVQYCYSEAELNEIIKAGTGIDPSIQGWVDAFYNAFLASLELPADIIQEVTPDIGESIGNLIKGILGGSANMISSFFGSIPIWLIIVLAVVGVLILLSYLGVFSRKRRRR